MYPTAEVRWFFTGSIPPEVTAWYAEAISPAQPSPPRTDHYLRVPDSTTLSIKQREGRIEIKQLQHDFGTEELGANASGQVGLWRKWSFSIVGSEYVLIPRENWLGVWKERSLYLYAVSADGTMQTTSQDMYPSRGCAVELTTTQCNDQTWWSIGLEAFGRESTLHDDLHTIASYVFSQADHPHFLSGDSFGYPDWLHMVAQ